MVKGECGKNEIRRYLYRYIHYVTARSTRTLALALPLQIAPVATTSNFGHHVLLFKMQEQLAVVPG